MKKVRKCPQCSSLNVTLWMGGKAGIIYACKDCSYHGPLVIEEDLEEGRAEEQMKTRQRKN